MREPVTGSPVFLAIAGRSRPARDGTVGVTVSRRVDAKRERWKAVEILRRGGAELVARRLAVAEPARRVGSCASRVGCLIFSARREFFGGSASSSVALHELGARTDPCRSFVVADGARGVECRGS
jgi:hypothetical protein